MGLVTKDYTPGTLVSGDTNDNILKLSNTINPSDTILIKVTVGSFKFNAFGLASLSNRLFTAGADDTVQITFSQFQGLGFKATTTGDTFVYSV